MKKRMLAAAVAILLVLWIVFLIYSKSDPAELLNPDGKTIAERFDTPSDYERTTETAESYQQYLRTLPVKTQGTQVKYYNGETKRKDVYEAVLDVDVGKRDLQQCADAAIRLRAEYLYGLQQYTRIHFNFTNGFEADYAKWMEGYRISVTDDEAVWYKDTGYSAEYTVFREYLDMVFAYAGTLSLLQEMQQIPLSDMRIGDVFLDKGHAIIIVDMAVNQVSGSKLFMLAQSYMPAQDIQILKNPQNKDLSPWYPLDFNNTLVTPEWTFTANDLRRFE